MTNYDRQLMALTRRIQRLNSERTKDGYLAILDQLRTMAKNSGDDWYAQDQPLLDDGKEVDIASA